MKSHCSDLPPTVRNQWLQWEIAGRDCFQILCKYTKIITPMQCQHNSLEKSLTVYSHLITVVPYTINCSSSNWYWVAENWIEILNHHLCLVCSKQAWSQVLWSIAPQRAIPDSVVSWRSSLWARFPCHSYLRCTNPFKFSKYRGRGICTNKQQTFKPNFQKRNFQQTFKKTTLLSTFKLLSNSSCQLLCYY